MSIRTRLTAGVLTLLIVVFATMGVMMARATESTMVTRVDNEIVKQSARMTGPEDSKGDPGRDGGPGGDDSQSSEQGQNGTPLAAAAVTATPAVTTTSNSQSDSGKNTIATLIYASDGSIRSNKPSGYYDEPDSPPRLPEFGSPEFNAMLGEIVTVSSEDGSLEYRVLIEPGRIEGDFVVAAGPLTDVHEAVGELIRQFLAIGAIGLALAAVASWWFIRREFNPVDRIINTAAAIASGDLSQRVVDDNPRTELGRLGGALNEMLGQIESGLLVREENEKRLRRFVADAAHELRTPLTSVRGYSELYRQGAYPDQASVDHAMSRIESEGARMARLVDDLLLLARMDQQRGIETRPLDLVSLASEAAADFETVTQDHPLDWDPDGEIMIRGDRIRLRQIIDNLLSNARTHTPSGTTIRMAVRRDGSEAELTIADNGPGIRAEDRERVFERFWRADSSRQRNTGGTGLGLAIVQSLVLAHGGSVKLVSEPGTGAEFTIRLPIAVS